MRQNAFTSIWLLAQKNDQRVDYKPCECEIRPCYQRLFSCCLLTGEKRPLPWVENDFDVTAVHSLRRLYLKRMLLALFADRNLSPLSLAHLLTTIPLSFIEPTLCYFVTCYEHHVIARSLSRGACSI